MILPQSYIGTLIVMILGILCAGLWANTYKASGRLRFEVYYIDFALGLILAALIIAFTFGNLGYDGFSIMDDLMQARKRQWMDAFGAGVLLNLATMFLAAAISLSGMAVGIPVALGLTLFVGILLGQMGRRSSNPTYLYLSGALVLVGIVAVAIAHSSVVASRKSTAEKQNKRTPGAARALILAAVSGLLMTGVYPLVNLARVGDPSLGPYSAMLFMAGGAFVSTFLFNLFFMNLPVQGQPLEITDYLKMQLKRHWYGVLGGVLWCTGTAAVLIAGGTAAEAQLRRGTFIALADGGMVVAGLCGLLVWKEFDEGGGRTKAIASAALVLFAAGLTLVALAFN